MYQIRLGHTDSVNSVNKQNFLDVELHNTSKPIHYTDIKKTVDEYEQFTNERGNCNRYRLIVTINPYCTNVLFNTLSEIVYAEGSDDCDALIDNSSTASKLKNDKIFGNTHPNRIGMIMNSEYSKPGCAKDSTLKEEKYVYHPGFDIFDNSLLRNTSFKVVNKPNSSTSKEYFNTIADKMRYSDGSKITYKRRESLQENGSTDIKSYDRHLYDGDDILSFENGDAINNTLAEDNGWYGFTNSSTVQSYDNSKNTDLGIGRVINYANSCEFIDMYPDRTLYSFNPKFNVYRHRLEYNWETLLTYPYGKSVKNDDGDDLFFLQDGNQNGLIVLSAIKTNSSSGENIIQIRSMIKHGLKRGDYIVLYFMNGDNWTEYQEKYFIVRNIGGVNNEDKNYYFTLNDEDLYNLIPFDENGVYICNKSNQIRFARTDGGSPCQYYIRKFKKLPNFKYAKSLYNGNGDFEQYINTNSVDKNGKPILFDHEQYKPGFDSTIYTDDTTQLVFTDTIDISDMKDDKGYPLSEIYLTVLKTNYGHDKWYSDKKYGDKNVEYSHCFGRISSGLEFSSEKGDYGTDLYNLRSECGDISIISKHNESPFEKDLTKDVNVFYGDVVEFNPLKATEKILQPFLHRFNTAQRELQDNTNLTYHEIWSDDWDAFPLNPSDGKLLTNGNGPFSVIEKTVADNYTTDRPEGYYYQPHYMIQVKELGQNEQGQHYPLPIKEISVSRLNGLYIKIVTTRSVNVNKGDIIGLFDGNGKIYKFVISYKENRTTYLLSPYYPYSNKKSWETFFNESGMNWLDVVNLSLKNELIFRKINENIPSYATQVGQNKYIWRKVLSVGDMDAAELPEYDYANNAFYITKEINFFLKRQDPKGWNHLYCSDGFPNDISGKNMTVSNYEYMKETQSIC